MVSLIVLDFLYNLVALWSGIVVLRGSQNQEGPGIVLAQIMGGLMLLGGAKNLLFIFMGNYPY